MTEKFKLGDTVRLSDEPWRHGQIAHVFERGFLRIRFDDGHYELCYPQDLEHD